MDFVAAAAVVSLVVGLLAVCLVRGVTRNRRRVPVVRGRLERAIEYGAGIVGGPLAMALLILGMGGTVGPRFEEEIMMIGPVLAMPASATVMWLTGELLAGPSRRSGWSMIGALLAAQGGFVVVAILSALAGRAILEKVGGTWLLDAAIHRATVLLPFVAGGAASAWTYRKVRGDVLLSA